MHVLITVESTESAPTKLLISQVREYHPDATISLLHCAPTPITPSALNACAQASIAVIDANSLDFSGASFSDLWLAGGASFARFVAIPVALLSGAVPLGAVVLSDEFRVCGPLPDLANSTPSTALGLLARDWDPSANVATGGWIPEFVVVGTECAPTLTWWAERGAHAVGLVESETAAIDLDDPWATFGNGGLAIEAITDPALRLSPLSASTLELTIHDGQVHVDGSLLRLAHIPSFDVGRPWWYSLHRDVDPPVLASRSDAIRSLGSQHANDLIDMGARPTSDEISGDTVFGIRIGSGLRTLLRERLAASFQDETPFVTPFGPHGPTPFIEWLRSGADAKHTGVSVIADAVWLERPDLATAFPAVKRSDRDRFVRWLWTHGLSEGLVSTGVLPEFPERNPVAIAPSTSAPREFGVNLVGYHDAELGLGVAVRRVAVALDAAAIPWKAVNYDRTNSRRRHNVDTDGSAPYRFNLILITPDQLGFFVEDAGAETLPGRYNIGLWYWETDVLTTTQRQALHHVDEVWGATSYLADVFAAATSKPVRQIPVPLEFPLASDSVRRREQLGLDDRFTVLFSFDFLSIMERKNPYDVIEAYRRAFSPDEGCRLVLKSINGDRHRSKSEALHAAVADHADIEFWDGYLSGEDRLALVAESDCYVSLHRSEGLGLTMAEAMAVGTPVVATNYSGNTDFMDENSALLVDFELVEIGPGSHYPAHGHWARPDVDHAAQQLRRLRYEPGLAEALAANGERALVPFTARRVGARIADRLKEIDA